MVRTGWRPTGLTPQATAWYFLRVSGAALVVLALGHLLVTHYLTAPSRTDSQFVAGRWANVLWLAFDWLLLTLALSHGLTGLQGVLKDYVLAGPARRLIPTAAAAVGLGFFAIGSATLLTADPAALRGGVGPLSGQRWIGELLSGLLFLVATGTYLGLAALAVWAVRAARRGRPLGRWRFAGQWAWALHRLTGVGIVGFLVVHILDVMLLPLAPDVYDHTVAAYAHPYLLPMEIALVGAVLYHALNGLRLIAIDLFERRAVADQRRLFYAVLGLTVALLLPSVVVLLRAGH
jgi:succinate dehydrogenase cytochrome b556 subunit